MSDYNCNTLQGAPDDYLLPFGFFGLNGIAYAIPSTKILCIADILFRINFIFDFHWKERKKTGY